MKQQQFFSECSICGKPLMDTEELTITPEKTIIHKKCLGEHHG